MKSKSMSNVVTQKFVWYAYFLTPTTVLTQVVLTLEPTSGSLGSVSGEIGNFLDMYRLCRIEDFKIVVNAIDYTAGIAAWDGFVVSYRPQGVNAPSNLLSIETAHSSNGVGDLASAYNKAVVSITRKDISVTAEAGGPGTGWLTTQNDGPAVLHFGFIDITSTTPVSGTPGNVGWHYRAECTMSFKELVDPTTISLRLKSRVNRADLSLSAATTEKSAKCPPAGQVAASVPCSWQGVPCACKNCGGGVSERT